MVLSRVFAVGLWLTVTVASTAMVWAATSIVAADVTDRPPAVIPHEEVVSALASDTTVPATAPATTTTLRPPATTTTVVPRGQSPAPTGSTTSVPRPPGVTVPTPAPTPTIAPPRPTTPTAPPTTQPALPTATYATVGGVVRVSCDGLLIKLISAIPNNGYSVRIPVNGPVNVEVHFIRSGEDVTVKSVCFGQPIGYAEPTQQTRGSGGR